jgi:hypothetical protein
LLNFSSRFAPAQQYPEMPHSTSIETAVVTLTGLPISPGREGPALRKILAALAQDDSNPVFDPRDSETLGPLAVASLDCLVEAILSGAITHTALQAALGPFFHGPAH